MQALAGHLNRHEELGCDAVATGLAKQTFNLAPKIKELDLLLLKSPHKRRSIYEVHPELSFWELNNQAPLPSKHSKEGKKLRTQLLLREGFPVARPTSKDFIDAFACLWSALRIHAGTAAFVPLQPPYDAHNLRMQIHW